MNRLLLALALAAQTGAAPAVAAPVHVGLKAGAAVTPDAAGFFSLAGVADLSGGGDALRARLGRVEMGRAPLPGDVRHLTRGDLALKLRQAGFQPGRDAVLDGADTADVTVTAPAPTSGGVGGSGASPAPPGLGAGGRTSPPASAAGAPLVHRGDIVTIRIDDSDISITAKGVARDGGAAGDTIHVHRDGCMADLAVTVLDAQTVQLEP